MRSLLAIVRGLVPLPVLSFLLAFLVAYTVLRFGILAIQPPLGRMPNDYMLLHNAAERFETGAAVYRATDASPFKYSPAFLLFFWQFLHALPLPLAWLLWSSISILLLALMCLWTWKAAFAGSGLWRIRDRTVPPEPIPLGPDEPAVQQLRAPGTTEEAFLLFLGCVGASTMLGWHGYLEHFSYGQCDVLLVGIYLLAVRFATSRKLTHEAQAALALGLVLATKPQMGILLSYFFLLRRWRLLSLAVLATAFIYLLPVPFVGVDRYFGLLSQWQSTLLGHHTVEFMTGNLNQSLASTLSRLTHNLGGVYDLTRGLVLASAVGILAWTWFWRKRVITAVQPQARLAGLVLLLYTVISPLSWRWLTFIWIIVAPIFLFDALKPWLLPKTDRPPRTAASYVQVVLSALLILNGILLQSAVANALGIHEVDILSFYGLYTLGNVLLLALAVIGVAKNQSYQLTS